mmetsp:Transcript_110402/g.235786  ORF Transcript_110402/g.235786 Transcript_110402/m.235786 type:complete len:515 (+) Transcript_110402:57-1601(+)
MGAESADPPRAAPLLGAPPRGGQGPVESLALEKAPGSAPAGVASASRSSSGELPGPDSLCRQNVRMMLAFQLLNALAWGTAMGPIFDRYLYYLGGGFARGPKLFPHNARNSLVGLTESISGLSSLFLAVPVGLLVDQNPQRRARLLRLSSIAGFVATAIFIIACLTDVVALMYLALIIMGVFSELASSASEAIFADSVRSGERSGIFTTKAIISSVGSAGGPALSAVGLALLGNTWEPYQMKAAIIGGSLLMPLSCICLFFFMDPPAAPSVPVATEPGGGDVAPETEEASADSSDTLQQRCGPFGPRHVPIILSVSDFITCIGAGMTVKFFNLFFIQDEGFSPVAINLLMTAYPLVIAAFMKVTQRLSKPLGRAQASLLFFSSNVVCLLLLSKVHAFPVLLAVFLIRGGLANSTNPLDRSILMDYTPSSQRGRWNAVQSFTSMTWSGSAFFGGLLSDSHDYRFTFLITALVYATGCLVYAPLLSLVPRREAALSTAREAALSTPGVEGEGGQGA